MTDLEHECITLVDLDGAVTTEDIFINTGEWDSLNNSMSVEAISELSEEQVRVLHHLYQHEWWTEDRHLVDVERMLSESDLVLGLIDSVTGDLVAFARVLTDSVYKALIFDVIVRDERRGTGLGGQLMEEILAHPDLADVDHFELYCLAELVPFYEQWGFTDDLGDLRLMRRD